MVIYLRPTESELVQQTRFTANNLQHEFQVIRLWEQPTESFLQRPGLLPYAVLSQTPNRSGVLQEVAQAIDSLSEPGQQANLAAATGILAGLVLDKSLIRRLLRREVMRESVIYQEWREEAQQDEARSLVLRQLKRRLGLLSGEVESYINTLVLTQLEDLAEALLDFSTVADLEGWLEQLPK